MTPIVHLVPCALFGAGTHTPRYVRIAESRPPAPLRVGAPLSEFEAIAERYPVYRIDPAPAQSARETRA